MVVSSSSGSHPWLTHQQVFLSLTLGIWIGWVIINGGNPLSGSFATLNAFVAVFEDAGNTRTIIFTLLIGALIALIQRSGGVAGFIEVVKSKLGRNAPEPNTKATADWYRFLPHSRASSFL
ncbi:hypothetical protein [Reichenbachiella ulvae]|uniref:Uncharacterized protein n=1 Tax=Reichenbachiella ulvae TaxID=2980104 RepID=A0ABT3D0R2_9BACT|nr:hypothetical protein [Reichenbachiella ulvae]MCV9389500.1 hypothetical protein [Reichenbachiella ulvae]